MQNVSFQLQDQLVPWLKAGELKKCESVIASRLAELPTSPFHIILDLSIKNDPEKVAEVFDEFFREEKKRIDIAAAYTEMNGFDINTDLWYGEPFAYRSYGGHQDYDWLSDWQSEFETGVIIEGLEPLQKVYASDAFLDPVFNDVCLITSLLIVVRFQDLIKRAASHMNELRFPLLATAHDYEFIYEVTPSAKS